MRQQNKTDNHALPYCLLPDVSTANARSDCISKIEETTQHVIASLEVITATKGVLIDAALRTAAEAITSRPISAVQRRRVFGSFPSSGSRSIF